MSLNKIALITGASGNLGKAVVEKLAAAGFNIIATVHQEKEKSAVHLQDIETVVVDLEDEAKVRDFVAAVIDKHQRIDVAVLTAGGFATGDIGATTGADLQKQYKLNFETAFHVVRPVFLQMMQQKEGRLFLIGARAGLHLAEAKSALAYGLSKSLLFGLATALNAAAKGMDVVTSVLVPSIIDTPENRKAMPDAHYENWVEAAQIADVICFYASPQARSIRNPVIRVYNNA